MNAKRSGHLEPWAIARFEASLRRATEQVIAIRREMGEEGDELRADVMADLVDAMADATPTLEMIEVEGQPEPQGCISVEEFFRAVLAEFGLDGSDMYLQETLYESVRRIVDEAIVGDEAGRTEWSRAEAWDEVAAAMGQPTASLDLTDPQRPICDAWGLTAVVGGHPPGWVRLPGGAGDWSPGKASALTQDGPSLPVPPAGDPGRRGGRYGRPDPFTRKLQADARRGADDKPESGGCDIPDKNNLEGASRDEE